MALQLTHVRVILANEALARYLELLLRPDREMV